MRIHWPAGASEQAELVYQRRAHVAWLPEDLVPGAMPGQFPQGMFIFTYPGGGIAIGIDAREVDLLVKVIQSHCSSVEKFWSDILGRDVTEPHVYAYERGKRRSEPKLTTDETKDMLKELGLL